MPCPITEQIFPLERLAAYPGSATLDATFCIPESMEKIFSSEPPLCRRRVWLCAAAGAPAISFNDTELTPQTVFAGEPRWLDYGVAELPVGFSQLRVRGLEPARCAGAFLVLTTQFELSPLGCGRAEVERLLWGLAREDAGHTTLEPACATAGSAVIFRARYTAGPCGLPAGAVVRFTVPRIMGEPQTADPQAAGYLSILAADVPVTFAGIALADDSHECFDIHCRLEAACAPDAGFTLQYAPKTAYLAPHQRGASERDFWYAPLPPLAAAVSLSDAHQPVSLMPEHSHTFTIVPGALARLHLFLPGRRFTGETLCLQGVFTDQYRNFPPSAGIAPEVELWLESAGERIALGKSTAFHTDTYHFSVPLPALPPAIYRVVARQAGVAEPLARSNPLQLVPPEDGMARIYWGELHGHTEMSDGVNDYPGLYRYARDVGCLDFAAASDHACYFSDNEWQWMQDVTNEWQQDGRFVTLVGYEWSGRQNDRNIFTSRGQLALFRGMYPPTSALKTVWNSFHGDAEVVGGVHAPLAHGVGWEQHDPAVERVVEIYSMWGANDDRANPLMREGDRQSPGMSAHELLLSGAKLGFTGGGDCHDGRVGFTAEALGGQGTAPQSLYAPLWFHCGLTAALLPDLTRRSLLHALRERATYATTGARLLLDFAIGELPMGAVGQVEQVICRFAVHGTTPLARVEIIRDGQQVWYAQPDALDCTHAWADPNPLAGEHWYYLRVTQADGEMAWSSPIWVAT